MDRYALHCTLSSSDDVYSTLERQWLLFKSISVLQHIYIATLVYMATPLVTSGYDKTQCEELGYVMLPSSTAAHHTGWKH